MAQSGSGRAQTVVWLVEDHEDCRRMVARAINRVEHLACAHAFGRCEEVLAALEREPAPDVVLMDVGLPGMNGIEGTRRIKARAPATQVIMLTVYADAARVLAAEFQRQTGLRVTVVEAPYLSLREKELTDGLLDTGAFNVLQVAHQWEGMT